MNQNSEQQARDQIDQQLTARRWTIQNKSSINLYAAKRAEDSHLTVHEEQSQPTLRASSNTKITIRFPLVNECDNEVVQVTENRFGVDKLKHTVTQLFKLAEALRQSISKKVFNAN